MCPTRCVEREIFSCFDQLAQLELLSVNRAPSVSTHRSSFKRSSGYCRFISMNDFLEQSRGPFTKCLVLTQLHSNASLVFFVHQRQDAHTRAIRGDFLLGFAKRGRFDIECASWNASVLEFKLTVSLVKTRQK